MVINNSKYYNDSLAYDFELFMPKQKTAEQDKIVKMPRKKAVEKKAGPKARAKAKRRVSSVASSILPNKAPPIPVKPLHPLKVAINIALAGFP